MNTSDFEIEPYDPCPCGSGKKFKFCCAQTAKAVRRGKYPIGTVAAYGPDDRKTTKIVAGVILFEGADPILERFVANDVLADPKIREAVRKHFAIHGVKTVAYSEKNMGCPHEEGIDFPKGGDCALCPFWARKQGSGRTDVDDEFADDGLDEDDDSENERFDEDGDAANEPLDTAWAQQRDRVGRIIGEHTQNHALAQEQFLAHLQRMLAFPCDVKLDFTLSWELPYEDGQWDQGKYAKLKEVGPSIKDEFELLSIEKNQESKWMSFPEDLSALVRRKSDGREFVLGVSDLKASDGESPNFQLLDDYAMWLDFRTELFPEPD